MRIQTFYVKPVICHCCVRIIREEMEKNKINLIHIAGGDVTLVYDEHILNEIIIENIFSKNGFQVVRNQEKIFVEKIKSTIINLIQFAENKKNSLIENLVEMLDCSFSYLSAVYAKYENTTLEEYIEKIKIEKAKHYLKSGELSFGEIAYILDYPYFIDFEKDFYKYEGTKVGDFIKNPKTSNCLLTDI